MKVLQISNKIPYPEKDGGVIAINAITEGLLKAGCDVKMLAMNTKKHFIDLSSIPEKFRNDRHFEAVDVDTDAKPRAAFIALVRGYSYNLSRFKSEDFSKRLTQILQNGKFDIIHLEGLYLTPYIPIIRQHSDAPIILRTHNVEWQIWLKLASEEKNIIKKWYFNTLFEKLKEYEEKVINEVDGIATITNTDLEYFMSAGCKVPMVSIPFGIDVAKYTPKESKYPNSLFYIGALDWLPNLQGIDWFLKNAWNNIVTKFPSAEFHIAGRNMPESLRSSSYKGVVIHGEVEDAKTFIQEYDIMLVPLLAGSGVRIKIIEGMAMGKPIITTSVGIEGIECNRGGDVMVANTPEQFADSVIRCLEEAGIKSSLGQHARKFAEENYDIGKAAARLMEFYKERILQLK
jgi:polysaccharide biosynthesis protein PslH